MPKILHNDLVIYFLAFGIEHFIIVMYVYSYLSMSGRVETGWVNWVIRVIQIQQHIDISPYHDKLSQ